MIRYRAPNKTEAEVLEQIAQFSVLVPAVVIVHRISDFSVVYLSEKGVEQLGVTLLQIQEMGPEYHARFFNPDDSADYVPKIFELLNRNKIGESVSYFQQVRLADSEEWTWHVSSTHVVFWNESDQPVLTLTISFPVNSKNHYEKKVEKLLDENTFLRKNYHIFGRLSDREQQVLRLLVLGKSSGEISNELFISAATVDTHRKNIKKKLKVSSFFELSQFARAFDLI